MFFLLLKLVVSVGPSDVTMGSNGPTSRPAPLEWNPIGIVTARWPALPSDLSLRDGSPADQEASAAVAAPTRDQPVRWSLVGSLWTSNQPKKIGRDQSVPSLRTLARQDSASSLRSEPNYKYENVYMASDNDATSVCSDLWPTDKNADADRSSGTTYAVRTRSRASAVADQTRPRKAYEYKLHDGTTGNLVFYYANFGKRSHNKELQNNIDAQLKRNPGHMMFMSEMAKQTAAMLEAPIRACERSEGENVNANVRKFYDRDELEWAVYCQSDELGDGCCIAVRKNSTKAPHIIGREDIVHPDGRSKDSKGVMTMCYTRILVCESVFHQALSAGYLGTNIMGMAVHLHHKTAKSAQGLAEAHHKVLKLIATNIIKFGVHILAIDANMALCIIPQVLRSYGITVSTAAYYPWAGGEAKVEWGSGTKNEPYMDSCAIFFVNCGPVEAKLVFPLSEIRDGDDLEAWDETGPRPRIFPEWPVNGGPGQKVKSYRGKKGDTLQDKFLQLLFDPDAPAGGEDGERFKGLRLKEKRVAYEVWALGGKFQRGSHYPLMVSTNNSCRRSEEALRKRAAKRFMGPKLYRPITPSYSYPGWLTATAQPSDTDLNQQIRDRLCSSHSSSSTSRYWVDPNGWRTYYEDGS